MRQTGDTHFKAVLLARVVERLGRPVHKRCDVLRLLRLRRRRSILVFDALVVELLRH